VASKYFEKVGEIKIYPPKEVKKIEKYKNADEKYEICNIFIKK